MLTCPHCGTSIAAGVFTETLAYDVTLRSSIGRDDDVLYHSGPVRRHEYDFGDEKFYCETCEKSFKEFKEVK